MLFRETVAHGTLELLEDLMTIPELADFALAGGTNLALRYGHKISADLDLFTNIPFDSNEIIPILLNYNPALLITSQRKSSIQCFINEIKVDIVLYEYRYHHPIETISGIRIVSIPDIIAMKLNTVSQRGARKDFWDIAELMEEYSIKQMLEFFKSKYKMFEIFHIVRSLTWLEDGDNTPSASVIPLNKTSWDDVKNKIQSGVRKYLDNDR